jgi:hypothetical protein
LRSVLMNSRLILRLTAVGPENLVGRLDRRKKGR